jgi:hypothetical protein
MNIALTIPDDTIHDIILIQQLRGITIADQTELEDHIRDYVDKSLKWVVKGDLTPLLAAQVDLTIDTRELSYD